METQYIDLTAAAKLLPGRPSVTTVWRWIARGRASNGVRASLRGVRGAHGEFYTTAEWVVDFIKHLEVKASADPQIGPEAAPGSTPTRTRNRPIGRHDAAREARLAAAEESLRRPIRKSGGSNGV
jgi:hypothetical protein